LGYVNIRKMRKKNILILIVLLVASFSSCGYAQQKGKIICVEQAGISRNLEYVKVFFDDYHENLLYLEDASDGTTTIAEKLKNHDAEEKSSTYIFPVSIKANERKTYLVTDSNKGLASSELKVSGEGMAIKVENKFFIADFNTTIAKEKYGLYPGQLAGIFIKKGSVLLERTGNNMHWAPNFQKEGLEYKTIGHADLKGSKITQSNSYTLELTKHGHVTNYEEIALYGKYNFYSGLPYFEYNSIMNFIQDVELVLLRNDEMTMDSLFTDLIYPDSLGMVKRMPLYDMVKFDSLMKSPLADDISWIGFVNESHGYGLVSLRLAYSNQNIDGKVSPLYKPHTKISAGRGNGRYWNRRLIHEHKTLVPMGSQYSERNVYLILDSLDEIDTKINYYINRLNNPVVVTRIQD